MFDSKIWPPMVANSLALWVSKVMLMGGTWNDNYLGYMPIVDAVERHSAVYVTA